MGTMMFLVGMLFAGTPIILIAKFDNPMDLVGHFDPKQLLLMSSMMVFGLLLISLSWFV